MRPQGSFFFLESRTTNLLWLGLLGLVVIFFFMLVFEAVAIESRLAKQVSEQLSQFGYDRAEVNVNGRDVSLVGAVSSAEARQRMVNIATAVEGVRVVSTNLNIEPLRLSHLRLRRDQSGWLEVSGELASQEALERLREQLKFPEKGEETGVFAVVRSVEVTESPWLAVIEEILEVSGDIQNFFLEISAHRLVIGGAVDSAGKYVKVIARIQALTESHALDMVNRLATINRLD